MMRNLPENAHFFMRDTVECVENHGADSRQQPIDQAAPLILPLDGYEALTSYFDRFMVPQSDQDTLRMAAA
jgi:hypothetical protein